MKFDYFLKLDGIPGESTDDKHSQWIEIYALSFGVTQPSEGPASGQGAAGYGRAQFHDFRCIKRLDKATAKLQEYAAAGKNISSGEVQVCRAAGQKQTVLQIKFKNLMVSVSEILANLETKYLNVRDEHEADPSEEGGQQFTIVRDTPYEVLTLKYGQISVTYTELDHATGASKGNVSYGHDLTTNKAAS
jgi:type VI secretion system secreted protein Hcp